MKTTLVAHLMVGILFGGPAVGILGATASAQTSATAVAPAVHDQDGDTPRVRRALPRLKLKRPAMSPVSPGDAPARLQLAPVKPQAPKVLRAQLAPMAPMARVAPVAPVAPVALVQEDSTPKLGVMIDITEDGLVVNDVTDDSLAERLGVESGDLLMKMDGRALQEVDDLRAALRETAPGKAVLLTVIRDGEGLVKLKTTRPKPQAPKVKMKAKTDAGQGAFLGVYLGEDGDPGVLVTGVVENSAAWHAGLAENDVLLSINDEGLDNGENVRDAVADHGVGSFISVVYVRDGQKHTTRARLGKRSPAPAALGSMIAPGQHVPGDLMEHLQNAQGGIWRFQGDHGDVPHLYSWSQDGDAGHNGFTLNLGDDEDGGTLDLHEFLQDHGSSGQGNRFFFSHDDGDGHGHEDGHGTQKSFKIHINDGVMKIDEDGDVRIIELDDLSDLSELEELDGLENLKIRGLNLKGLKGDVLKSLHGGKGEARYEIKVHGNTQSSGLRQAQPRVRTLGFTPKGAKNSSVIVTTTTECTGDAAPSCEEDAAAKSCASACDAEVEVEQETGSVN